MWFYDNMRQGSTNVQGSRVQNYVQMLAKNQMWTGGSRSGEKEVDRNQEIYECKGHASNIGIRFHADLQSITHGNDVGTEFQQVFGLATTSEARHPRLGANIFRKCMTSPSNRTLRFPCCMPMLTNFYRGGWGRPPPTFVWTRTCYGGSRRECDVSQYTHGQA